MVNRVSSFGQQQQLIRNLSQNQSRVFEDQRQITTGKRSDDFAGLAGDTNTILGARSFRSRVETYERSISDIRGKLDANDVQLGGILDSSRELRQTLLLAISNNRAEGVPELLEESFSFITSALNANLGGVFLFSGAKTGTKPVNVTELADLAALPSVADAFDNSDIAFKARIADDVELDFGLLANEVAEPLFQVMKEIHDFHNGPSGPLVGELTPTQFDFLKSKLADMESAITKVQQFQTSNGLAFQRLDIVERQHADTNVFLETFIADLEDVDIAEAITNLNNDQLALEASYQALATLTSLSLLRFI